MEVALLWDVLGQQGPVTRVALCEELGWSIKKVCIILQSLHQYDLVVKIEPKIPKLEDGVEESGAEIVETEAELALKAEAAATEAEVFSDEPIYGRRRRRKKIVKNEVIVPVNLYKLTEKLNPFQISQANKLGLQTPQLEKYCKLDLNYARKIVSSAEGFDQLAKTQKNKLLQTHVEVKERQRKMKWRQKHPDLLFLLGITSDVLSKQKKNSAVTNMGEALILEQMKAGLEELVEHCRLQTSV